MKEVTLYLGVATLGVVIYHLGQKVISSSVNPMVLLMGVYFVAFLLALAAVPLFQTTGQTHWVRQLISWPVLIVGIGVILIEGGFLLAYRFGGSLQWSGVAVNGLAAILLVPIAVLAFHEHLSPARIFGILLTLTGMAFMARK
jgi:drug/metabolite transporter (DMT)-like permease